MIACSATSPARKPAPSRASADTLTASPPSRSPVRDKPSPAYRRARDGACGIEIGAGWRGGGQGQRQDDVGLTLAHPDIGPRAYKVKLGRAAGQDDDDVFALIWNLRGLTGPALAPPRAGATARPNPPAKPREKPRVARRGAQGSCRDRGEPAAAPPLIRPRGWPGWDR